MQAQVSFHPFFFFFFLVARSLLMFRLHHNSFYKYTHKYTVHTVIGGGAWIQWEKGREGEQKTHTHAHKTPTRRATTTTTTSNTQHQRHQGPWKHRKHQWKGCRSFCFNSRQAKKKLRPAVSLQHLGEDGIENPTTIKGAPRHCYPPCLTFKSFSRFLVTSAIACLLLLQ